MKEWYLRIGEREIGPVAADFVQKMLDRGQLRPDAPIRREGGATWRPVAEHPVFSIKSQSGKRPGNWHAPDRQPATSASTTPVATVAATEPARSGIRGYIATHWEGGHSLGRSYWVNTFGVNVLFILCMVPFEFLGNRDSRLMLLPLVALMIVALPVTVWCLVGLWRSARNDWARNKRRFLPGLAQAMVVFGVLGTVADYAVNGPTYLHTAKVAFGLDNYGVTEVAYNDADGVITLRGPLEYGASRRVEALLRAHPGTDTLRVSSVGGRMAPADALARLFEEGVLETLEIVDRCMSACANMMFSAAVVRMEEGSAVGFHQSNLSDGNGYLTEVVRTLERQRLDDAGVSPGFRNKVLSTGFDDLYVPGTGVLFEEDLIDFVVAGDALLDHRAWVAYEIRSGFEAELPRIHAAIREHDELDFVHEFADAYVDDVVSGRLAFDEAATRVGEDFGAELMQRLAVGTDRRGADGLFDLYRPLVAELEREDYRLCRQSGFDAAVREAFVQHLGERLPEYDSALAEAYRGMIRVRQGASQPVRPFAGTEAVQILDRSPQGQLLLEQADRDSNVLEDPVFNCRFFVVLYRQIVPLETETKARFVASLLSRG